MGNDSYVAKIFRGFVLVAFIIIENQSIQPVKINITII